MKMYSSLSLEERVNGIYSILSKLDATFAENFKKEYSSWDDNSKESNLNDFIDKKIKKDPNSKSSIEIYALLWKKAPYQVELMFTNNSSKSQSNNQKIDPPVKNLTKEELYEQIIKPRVEVTDKSIFRHDLVDWFNLSQTESEDVFNKLKDDGLITVGIANYVGSINNELYKHEYLHAQHIREIYEQLITNQAIYHAMGKDNTIEGMSRKLRYKSNVVALAIDVLEKEGAFNFNSNQAIYIDQKILNQNQKDVNKVVTNIKVNKIVEILNNDYSNLADALKGEAKYWKDDTCVDSLKEWVELFVEKDIENELSVKIYAVLWNLSIDETTEIMKKELGIEDEIANTATNNPTPQPTPQPAPEEDTNSIDWFEKYKVEIVKNTPGLTKEQKEKLEKRIDLYEQEAKQNLVVASQYNIDISNSPISDIAEKTKESIEQELENMKETNEFISMVKDYCQKNKINTNGKQYKVLEKIINTLDSNIVHEIMIQDEVNLDYDIDVFVNHPIDFTFRKYYREFYNSNLDLRDNQIGRIKYKMYNYREQATAKAKSMTEHAKTYEEDDIVRLITGPINQVKNDIVNMKATNEVVEYARNYYDKNNMNTNSDEYEELLKIIDGLNNNTIQEIIIKANSGANDSEAAVDNYIEYLVSCIRNNPENSDGGRGR